MKSKRISDKTLIQRYQQSGDTAALATLLSRHIQGIEIKAFSLLKDTSLAKDTAQETICRAIFSIKNNSYVEQGRIGGWLQTICHNLCLDHFKKKKWKTFPFEQHLDEHSSIDMHLVSDEISHGRVEKKERDASLKDLVQRLPIKEREVILLRHYGDFKFREIACLTNCSIGTIKARMHYALKNLRKMINSQENDLRVA